MRWAGFMRVRNEEDILEAAIRHNLSYLDRLVVVDHASDDATPAILDALLREGLPLAVERDGRLEAAPRDDDLAHLDRLLEAGADLAFLLGADDFLRVASRGALEDAVASATPGARLRLAVAIARPGSGSGDMARRLHAGERLIDPRPPRHAVEVRIARALPAGSGTTIDIDPAIASVFRIPVRGADQYAAKVAVAHLARLLAARASAPGEATDEGYAALLAGRAFDERMLLDALVNEGRTGDDARMDPRHASFADAAITDTIALRHTPADAPRPLARLLGFGERVAAEIARTTGGL